ncbi:MAG: alpha/beta hydrolase [Aliidongia sp.]
MRWVFAAAMSMVMTMGAAQAVEPVSFPASDGGTVHGDLYRSATPAKAVILLFHQAGSNRGEYEPIAPRLTALGYDALAVDQRAGGTLWGHGNQTVTERGGPVDNIKALPDLEGALAYATKTWPGRPVIAWGSSYSASLVFFLAARHPSEIAAVLSFSPGEYFPRCLGARPGGEDALPGLHRLRLECRGGGGGRAAVRRGSRGRQGPFHPASRRSRLGRAAPGLELVRRGRDLDRGRGLSQHIADRCRACPRR